MEKGLSFNSLVRDVEVVNPLFSRAKVYVLYTGINRNNSYISKEAVEKSLNTIYNIPIIGEYFEDKDNFGGHGGKLEITDTEIKMISTTVPYGLVPESANIYWENVTEKDGTINEYLVIDGVYLWSGRYPELSVLIEEGKMGQSMEIEVSNGDFSIVDGKEVFKIHDFIFSGLCILGVDKGGNPDDHVEPCFESSSIVISYSLNKDKFKQEFNQMLAELKFSISKGGNTVEDVKQEFEETTVETPEQVEDTVVNENVEEVTETKTDENTTQTETKSEDETIVEEKVDNEESTEFENEETQKEQVEEEFQDVEVENSDDVDESKEEEVVEEAFSKEFVEGLQSQIETLSNELEALKSYKRQREEQDLSSQFAGKLSEDEMKQVFSDSKDLSLEEVETKLLALFGKKNFSIKQEAKNENKIEIPVVDKTETINEPYNGLFSKYLSK